MLGAELAEEPSAELVPGAPDARGDDLAHPEVRREARRGAKGRERGRASLGTNDETTKIFSWEKHNQIHEKKNASKAVRSRQTSSPPPNAASSSSPRARSRTHIARSSLTFHHALLPHAFPPSPLITRPPSHPPRHAPPLARSPPRPPPSPRQARAAPPASPRASRAAPASASTRRCADSPAWTPTSRTKTQRAKTPKKASPRTRTRTRTRNERTRRRRRRRATSKKAAAAAPPGAPTRTIPARREDAAPRRRRPRPRPPARDALRRRRLHRRGRVRAPPRAERQSRRRRLRRRRLGLRRRRRRLGRRRLGFRLRRLRASQRGALLVRLAPSLLRLQSRVLRRVRRGRRRGHAPADDEAALEPRGGRAETVSRATAFVRRRPGRAAALEGGARDAALHVRVPPRAESRGARRGRRPRRRGEPERGGGRVGGGWRGARRRAARETRAPPLMFRGRRRGARRVKGRDGHLRRRDRDGARDGGVVLTAGWSFPIRGI